MAQRIQVSSGEREQLLEITREVREAVRAAELFLDLLLVLQERL